MKAMLTPRKVSISIEQAKKDKLIELAPGGESGSEFQRRGGTTYKSHLFASGWNLTSGDGSDSADYLSKMVQMPLLVETPHANGGVPDVGEATQDDILNGVNDLIEQHGITPVDLAKIINNGLYLSYNAANKPKSTVTQADMMSLFAKKSKPSDHVEYFSAAAKGAGEGLSWLKNWFSKNA